MHLISCFWLLLKNYGSSKSVLRFFYRTAQEKIIFHMSATDHLKKKNNYVIKL